MVNYKTFALGLGIVAVFIIGLLGCAGQQAAVKSDLATHKVKQTNVSDQVNIESSNAKSPILISSPESTPTPAEPTSSDTSLPVETPDVE